SIRELTKRGFGNCGSMSGEGWARGGSEQPSEGSAGPPRKTRRLKLQRERVVSCCVNQLLTATLVDNVFKVRGVVVSQVIIVGVIRQAEKVRNCIIYKIDDMTSKPIEARHWLARDIAKETTPLPVGAYVKVYGVLQSFAEARRLKIFMIRVLDNMNELTVNILDTVDEHMTLGKALQN
uniref:OB domain-containing protein n=1 Tax=Otolemur garnettii TaxID=30611 RepID=H0XUP0_OTOGA